MQIVGVISEYNPFHYGHLYHLNKIKSDLITDGIICVMSGNFVQRGEPAIFNKWARTEMALGGGVDLVVELPTCFATSTAEIFAESAIRLLNSMQIVQTISFGMEHLAKKELLLIGKLLATEPDLYKKTLKTELKNGKSFPEAREKAIIKYIQNTNLDCNIDAVLALLNNPNSILAIEYVKAIHKTNSGICIHPIFRIGAGYHNKALEDKYSSATAVRNALSELSVNGILNKVPEFCSKIFQREIQSGFGPISLKDFETMILYILRRTSTQELSRFFDVSEGLENRIKRISKSNYSIDNMINEIKTKRYPVTRIQRILMHVLLNIDKSITETRKPAYIRILGFNDKGVRILRRIKNKCTLPVITKASDYKQLDPTAKSMFEIDLTATDIYSIAYRDKSLRKCGIDFRKKPLYYKSSK